MVQGISMALLMLAVFSVRYGLAKREVGSDISQLSPPHQKTSNAEKVVTKPSDYSRLPLEHEGHSHSTRGNGGIQIDRKGISTKKGSFSQVKASKKQAARAKVISHIATRSRLHAAFVPLSLQAKASKEPKTLKTSFTAIFGSTQHASGVVEFPDWSPAVEEQLEGMLEFAHWLDQDSTEFDWNRARRLIESEFEAKAKNGMITEFDVIKMLMELGDHQLFCPTPEPTSIEEKCANLPEFPDKKELVNEGNEIMNWESYQIVWAEFFGQAIRKFFEIPQGIALLKSFDDAHMAKGDEIIKKRGKREASMKMPWPVWIPQMEEAAKLMLEGAAEIVGIENVDWERHKEQIELGFSILVQKDGKITPDDAYDSIAGHPDLGMGVSIAKGLDAQIYDQFHLASGMKLSSLATSIFKEPLDWFEYTTIRCLALSTGMVMLHDLLEDEDPLHMLSEDEDMLGLPEDEAEDFMHNSTVEDIRNMLNGAVQPGSQPEFNQVKAVVNPVVHEETVQKVGSDVREVGGWLDDNAEILSSG